MSTVPLQAPGTEDRAATGTVCHCLGITARDLQQEIAATGHSSSRDRIVALIRSGRCACSRLNPSGRCCLGDVDENIRCLRQSRQVPQAPGSARLPVR